MILKRAALGVAALAATLVATPGAAVAGPNDNRSATVSGVAAVAAANCPTANFCLYTERGFRGKMFKLFHCKVYSLHGWNGSGSWQNSNTGGAVATIMRQNRSELVSSNPPSSGLPYANSSDADFNFVPAWFVKAC